MNNPKKIWIKGSLLASAISPLASLSCLAKDLSPADLARMGEASAVRIGCGATIGISDFAVVAATGPNVIGALMCSALILTAVRFLPKPLGNRCWNLIWVATVTYFLAMVPLFLTGSSAGLDAQLSKLLTEIWIGCSLVAVPAITMTFFKVLPCLFGASIQSAQNCLRSLKRCRAKSPANRDTLSVRVDGNTVTLRQGSYIETRVVEDLAQAETCQDEVASCQTR